MDKSKELRWFTKDENKTINKWFACHGLNFNSANARTDYYLTALINDDTIPKLREGKIEIKHKIGTSEAHSLTPNAEGYFEKFLKWSFELDNEDELSDVITNTNRYTAEWKKVYKERMGVQLARAKDGTLKVHDIGDSLQSGCQIEYTRIKVNSALWYSFNLEWFGNEFLELDSSFVSEILGNSILKLEDSMNYGRFLKLTEE